MIMGSLFTGAGGLDKGLEDAGFQIVFQVENDPFCNKVLEKQWPDTLRFQTIQEFNQLIYSAAASPAKTSLLPGIDADFREQGAVYGLSSQKPFAYYDQNTSLWKTCQGSFLAGLDEFSETWPRSGMMRNGIAYQRRPSVPHIDDIDCLLLPTPTRADTKHISSNPDHWRRRLESGRSGMDTLPEFIIRELGHGDGRLNSCFVEWMLGVPECWTEIER